MPVREEGPSSVFGSAKLRQITEYAPEKSVAYLGISTPSTQIPISFLPNLPTRLRKKQKKDSLPEGNESIMIVNRQKLFLQILLEGNQSRVQSLVGSLEHLEDIIIIQL